VARSDASPIHDPAEKPLDFMAAVGKSTWTVSFLGGVATAGDDTGKAPL
jgi:hypothetical protein